MRTVIGMTSTSTITLAVMLLVLGCGGNNDAQPTKTPFATPTVLPTATATASLQPEDEVLTAYEAYLEAYREALLQLDDSLADTVATGEERQRIRQEINTMRSQGVALRLVTTHNPVIIDITANSAVVFDESIDNSFFVDAVTKDPPVASGSGERLQQTFYFEKVDSTWLVVRGVRHERGR